MRFLAWYVSWWHIAAVAVVISATLFLAAFLSWAIPEAIMEVSRLWHEGANP